MNIISDKYDNAYIYIQLKIGQMFYSGDKIPIFNIHVQKQSFTFFL